MRPRGLLETTVAMAVANLFGFINVNWTHHLVVATLIGAVMLGYVALWFYWKGRNWARLLVLLCSVVAVLNLLFLLHPRGNALFFDISIIANAVLGIFLLYWLNRPGVRAWFKSQKQNDRLTGRNE